MRFAFLFPGQGAQYVGMGKQFVEQFATARRIFEEAEDQLSTKILPLVLDGPSELLTETKNSQVAIFVTSVAILNVLQELFPSLKPTYCSGLSLGEYTALHASQKILFSDCLSLVQFRGQSMNDACEATQGTMAVILGLDADAVENIVREVNLPHDLWAANFNCPGQVVISGTRRGIELGTAAVLAKGAKRVLPLQVHGAFHSGLMKQAEERLAPRLLEAKLNESPINLVMNVVGKTVTDVNEMRRNLIQQVTHPVRWEQGVRFMNQAGVDLYIEIGCGKTLAGFNKRIAVTAPTINVETVADLQALEASIR